MTKLSRLTSHSEPKKELGFSFYCPGCANYHVFYTKPHKGGKYKDGKWTAADGPVWKFDGNMESPTFTPSLLIYEGRHPDGELGHPRCHLFVRQGKIQFLGDCGHKLKGQTVDMIDVEQTP